MDANEAEFEVNTRLFISNFDLNNSKRDEKINDNIVEKDKIEENLILLINRRDKISDFLKKMCVDSMDIPTCGLISFDGKIRVNNYAFPVVSQEEKYFDKWENFSIDLAKKIQK